MEFDPIYATKSGLWSVPCPQCGKRATHKYSNDDQFCHACMLQCAGRGHVPDDDDANTCYHCGWNVRAGIPKMRQRRE